MSQSSCHDQAGASEPVRQGPGRTLGAADSSGAKGAHPAGRWEMVYTTEDGGILMIFGVYLSSGERRERQKEPL